MKKDGCHDPEKISPAQSWYRERLDFGDIGSNLHSATNINTETTLSNLSELHLRFWDPGSALNHCSTSNMKWPILRIA